MRILIDVPDDQVERIKPILKKQGHLVKREKLVVHIRRIAEDAILQFILGDGKEYVLPRKNPHLEQCKQYRQLSEELAEVTAKWKAVLKDIVRGEWSPQHGSTLLEAKVKCNDLFNQVQQARLNARRWRNRNKDFKAMEYRAMLKKAEGVKNVRRKRRRSRPPVSPDSD